MKLFTVDSGYVDRLRRRYKSNVAFAAMVDAFASAMNESGMSTEDAIAAALFLDSQKTFNAETRERINRQLKGK